MRAPRLRLEAAALALGGALAAVFWAARLPASLDALTPRVVGSAAIDLFAGWVEFGRGRSVLAAFAYLTLAAMAAVLALEIRDAWRRGKPKGREGWLKAGVVVLALYVLAHGARLAIRAPLDVIQNALFFPESKTLGEPLLTWAALSWAIYAAGRAARAGLGRLLAKESSLAWLKWSAALAGTAVFLQLWAVVGFDAGKTDFTRAAALPTAESGRRALTILSPKPQGYAFELGIPGSTDYTDARLASAEQYAARGRSVHRRAGLRFLYSGYAFAMDAVGLRRALRLGAEAGDPLARNLLLEHLACAPDAPEVQDALALLSDERRFAAGPQAAAKLARAQARLGHEAAARSWLERARSGIPEGLLTLPQGGSVGVVEGRLKGLPGARVGLYCRPDEAAPYALGPVQLAAAQTVGADDKFRFEKLPPGSYFLAVARDGRGEFKVKGSRGDLVVTARKPRHNLTLEVR